jgi:hypothetical protein
MNAFFLFYSNLKLFLFVFLSIGQMTALIHHQANIFDNVSTRGFQVRAYKITTRLNLFQVASSNFIKGLTLPNNVYSWYNCWKLKEEIVM